MTVPLPTMDKFTLLGEMGYNQPTLNARLTKFFQDITGLNTVGELLIKSLDQQMARDIIGVTASGGAAVIVPGDLQTTGTPTADTALFGDGSWKLVDTSNLDITKADVGLGNVDNTADVNKPLSVPQQTYVDSAIATVTTNSAPKDGANLTNATTPTPPLTDADTTIANTEFVANRVNTYTNAVPGARFDVKCIGGVQPLRNTLSTRTDIFFDYLMVAQPKDAATFPGYAIIGDGWRQESW